MDKITQLAIKCGVSRGTVMNVAKRIHDLEGGDTYRYPTEDEIINRKRFYKKSGRPPKYPFTKEENNE